MLYFAYGSNMYTRDLIARIGQIETVGIDVLLGYSLRFNKISKDGSAKANIQSFSGAVNGVLYEMTEAQFEVLDVYERGYTRIEIELASGKRAQVYISHKIDNTLMVSLAYLNKIVKGALEHGITAI